MNTEKQIRTNTPVTTPSFSPQSPDQLSTLERLDMLQLQRFATNQRPHRETMSPKTILQLQRSIGNRAVNRLLTGAAQSQAVKQVTPENTVQRMVMELWNFPQDQPNKKSWNLYAKRLSQNWPGVSNDTMALPMVVNLIKKLNTLAQINLMSNSTVITKNVYEHYKENPSYLHDLVSRGATRSDLEVSMLLNGDRGRVNADNLDWFYQNHQQNVVLNWSEWFEYTNQRQWDPGTYDAEISVSIGGTFWGVIHVHYPRDAENDEVYENNIGAIHIKPDKWSNSKYNLGNQWKPICQALIDQNINARPVLQIQ